MTAVSVAVRIQRVNSKPSELQSIVMIVGLFEGRTYLRVLCKCTLCHGPQETTVPI